MIEQLGSVWRITLFGVLRAEREERKVDRFQTKQTASLLAYLSLHPGRFVARDVLCEMLWPASRPEAARASLNQAISWLRKEFEDEALFRTDRRSVAVEYDRITTDVGEFQAWISDCAVTRDERRHRLEKAVALCSSELLEGSGESWVRIERSLLTESYVRALKELCDLCEEAGDHDAAIQRVVEILRLEPLDEDHHLRLLHLYAITDQLGAVQRHNRELEEMLREQGRSPSPRFRAIVQQLLHSDEVSESRGEPALPHLLTRFFGREEEVSLILDRIEKGARLITLLGVSGMGKTRLSLEISHRFEQQSKHVAFVSLAELNHGEEIPMAILRKLGVEGGGNQPTWSALRHVLARNGPTLVVLDNFDQFADSSADFVHELLTSLPHLSLLITSQAPLNLKGETIIGLKPLPVPAPGDDLALVLKNPSFEMFVDRARLAAPDFRPTPENAKALADLCRRLEGMPLAIELAAAWAQPHSPEEILADLSGGPELLYSEERDRPERHWSLRASFEYSFNLLPNRLQDCLASLSVFEGGWTQTAASAVTEDVDIRHAIRLLIERSLVTASTETAKGATRYRMLETLKQFVRDHLRTEQTDALIEKHAQFFSAFAQEAFRESTGSPRAIWVDALRDEAANLSAALHWFESSGRIEDGLRMVVHLAWFWQVNGPLGEARARCRSLLDKAPKDLDLSLLAQSNHALGNLELVGSNLDGAQEAFQAALSLERTLGAPCGIAAALAGLSGVALRRNQLDEAKELLKESIELSEQIGDSTGSSRSHLYLAFVLSDMGQYEDAKRHFDRTLALEAEREDLAGIARVYTNLSHWARFQSKYVQARYYAEESLRLYTKVGQRLGVARAKLNLGEILLREEEYSAALSALTEALRDFDEIGDPFGVQVCVGEIVMAAAHTGAFTQAIRLMTLESRMAEQLQAPRSPVDEALYRAACSLIAEGASKGERESYELWALVIPRHELPSASLEIAEELRREFSMSR